jgi:NAD(P)-dependent dehydrogenase (short-subunit alcohol dehydrogenase family)
VSDELLRAGVLDGVVIVVAGAPDGELGAAVAQRCVALGASVRRLDVNDLGEEALAASVEQVVADGGAADLLVNDAASLFAQAPAGLPALRACLDASWNATRAIAGAAFLGDRATGGRIVNVAPRPSAGEHAEAARAGLENLARTLSTEWARHAVVVTTIAPGESTAAGDIADLVAFLASPAGGYYSGCLFTLGAVQ